MNITKITFLAVALLLAGNFAQAQASSEPPDQYTLLPGDTLNVAVWKEPELQKDVVIRPDGRFSFPLAGDIVAIGKSVTEVEQELTAKLEQFIPEVVITVSVTATLGNKIYVIGQVQKPGEYIVNPMVDVIQALSMAGGMTAFAAVNDVIVLRRIHGVQSIFSFRYGEVEKGKSLAQNILLAAGDVVIVP